MTGAARARPDAPGTAVGFVNMLGNVAIVAGTPLLGLAFIGGADGRVGFACVAALWASSLLWLPGAIERGYPSRSTASR